VKQITGLPARLTPLAPAGGVITGLEVLRSGRRSWAPAAHRAPRGLVSKLDSDSITIVPCLSRRPLTLSESHLNSSRGPRPSGTGSCRNWGFNPTGLFDPMTMVLPEVRITKPRGRPLGAGSHGILVHSTSSGDSAACPQIRPPASIFLGRLRTPAYPGPTSVV